MYFEMHQKRDPQLSSTRESGLSCQALPSMESDVRGCHVRKCCGKSFQEIKMKNRMSRVSLPEFHRERRDNVPEICFRKDKDDLIFHRPSLLLISSCPIPLCRIISMSSSWSFCCPSMIASRRWDSSSFTVVSVPTSRWSSIRSLRIIESMFSIRSRVFKREAESVCGSPLLLLSLIHFLSVSFRILKRAQHFPCFARINVRRK